MAENKALLRGTVESILRSFPPRKSCEKCRGQGLQKYVTGGVSRVLDLCACVRGKISRSSFTAYELVEEKKPDPS